jgi:2-polyprenyl-3-methyl-5-hydroxy-6-metoxy-1,4-benzoquinol methylase
MPVPGAQITEDAFRHYVAPDIKQIQGRFWAAEIIEQVSFPVAGNAQLAKIEETSFWFRHRNEILAAVMGQFRPAGLLMDIGGGNGCVSLELNRRGIQTVVVEPGDYGARMAHDRGLTVLRATFKPDTFIAGQVPAIGLFDVIEHIADDKQFLKNCWTTLASSGYLYVTVPALQFLWSSDDEFAGHYRRYNRRTLARVLTDAGFEILLLSHFFSLLVPMLFLARTLPSTLGRRKVRTMDEALVHHRSAQRLSTLVERLFRLERIMIASGRAVPIGTSLVVVARKPIDANAR